MKKTHLLLTFPVIGAILLATASTPIRVPSSIGTSQLYAQSTTSAQKQLISEAYDSKATNLRITMQNILKEHTVLGNLLLTGIYTGNDTKQLDSYLSDNSKQLTSIIQSVYGKNTATPFQQLWKEHMDEYVNYTKARKNSDTAKADAARSRLDTISIKIGDLLDKAGDNLSAGVVTTLMKEHVNGTLTFVNALSSGTPAKQADAVKSGYIQAGKFADELSRGIILDKPSMFE